MNTQDHSRATPPSGATMTRDAAHGDGTEARAYDFELCLDRATVDTEARTIAASLSSETPVDRHFGAEVLRHSREAVDLGRAVHGLPLLFNHDRDRPLGVVRGLQVVDGVLRGVLHFARSVHATEIWEQVRDGFLSNMSVGYRVSKWDVDADAEVHTATRWSLLEASVVTVPADMVVGIGRAVAAQSSAVALRNDDDTVVNFQAVQRQARAEGLTEGQRAERERIAGIRELFARPHFDGPQFRALCDDLVAQGVTVEAAGRQLLDAVGNRALPIADARSDDAGRGRSLFVAAGDDELDKFRDAGAEVLTVRAGIERDPERVRGARANELNGLNLVELAREYLRRGGVRATGLGRMEVVGQAFTRVFTPGASTSDFANLLSNTAEKAMLVGWDEAEETWAAWCKIGRLPDFKTADRVGMSGFGDLDQVPENGEFTIGQFADLKETIKLLTYGKRFPISRQAIINDDLTAFTEIPRKMGRAANRKVGDLAYERLTSNPTLNQDGVALFDATHGNLVGPGSGAAPSVATLNAGFTAMATQTAPSPDGGTTAGHRINVRPRYLLVPVALEVSARTLVAAQYDPAGTAGTLTPNPFQNTLQVVGDARLDADDPAQWYLLASPMQVDTVEVAFLDGEQRPFLDTMDGWTIDGVDHKVRIDAGAMVGDFRGAYQNDGN